MIPNKWGLIRQRDLDLAALPIFFSDINLSEYAVETINTISEILPDTAFTVTSGTQSRPGMSAITYDNIDKYDYVIAPVASNGSFHGVSGTGLGSGLSYTVDVTQKIKGYAFIDNRRHSDKLYVTIVSEDVDKVAPIGLYRHRSDHVNPLGVIQPLNPRILQPDVDVPGIHEEDMTVQEPEEEQEEA